MGFSGRAPSRQSGLMQSAARVGRSAGGFGVTRSGAVRRSRPHHKKHVTKSRSNPMVSKMMQQQREMLQMMMVAMMRPSCGGH